ncbi:MAG: hypothetical protein GPJ54_21270, partial [Candidatus Heimdallarchaeota archaeon]|nr:hypothetical protein [Candidatus Heimdallarchaeota archaeon]
TILIEGTGYVGGQASGFHDISSSPSNTTSSAGNSTGNSVDSGFGSFISVNSVQSIGIIVITATAGFAPARRYLKRRK